MAVVELLESAREAKKIGAVAAAQAYRDHLNREAHEATWEALIAEELTKLRGLLRTYDDNRYKWANTDKGHAWLVNEEYKKLPARIYSKDTAELFVNDAIKNRSLFPPPSMPIVHPVEPEFVNADGDSLAQGWRLNERATRLQQVVFDPDNQRISATTDLYLFSGGTVLGADDHKHITDDTDKAFALGCIQETQRHMETLVDKPLQRRWRPDSTLSFITIRVVK